MPDPPAAPEQEAARDEAALAEPDDWQPGLDGGSLPRRPRRKLVTPLTIAGGAVVLATVAFIVGVEVQKGRQAPSGAPTAASARFPGAPGAGGGGGGGGGAATGRQGQGDLTFGSVINKKGGTLYVQNADGTTVRVKTTAQSKVTRNAATSPRGIYPGDTIIVQGTKSKNGDVVATQITATAKTAAGSGGAAGGRFGGAPGAAPGG